MKTKTIIGLVATAGAAYYGRNAFKGGNLSIDEQIKFGILSLTALIAFS